jgi:hypothetical protein
MKALLAFATKVYRCAKEQQLRRLFNECGGVAPLYLRGVGVALSISKALLEW